MNNRSVRRRCFGAGLVLAAALALTACGGDPASEGVSEGVGVGAQPLQNGTFGPGILVNLPKPAAARPFAAPAHRHGTWVQSFEIDGLSPLETMQYFESALPPVWEESTPSMPLGSCFPPGGESDSQCTYRETWIQGTQRLEIVAGPAGIDITEDRTELSLLLEGA
jgi:hypothetical protein